MLETEKSLVRDETYTYKVEILYIQSLLVMFSRHIISIRYRREGAYHIWMLMDLAALCDAVPTGNISIDFPSD